MNCVLGLPRQLALARLAEEGYAVHCRELRSRKGGDGTDERIVAQRELSDGAVELLYARFVTSVEENE